MIIKKKQFLHKNLKIGDLLFFIFLIAWPVLQFSIFYIFVNFNSLRIAFIDSSGNFSFSNFSYWFADKTAWNAISSSALQSLKYFLICTGISIPLALLFSYYIYTKLHGSALFKVVLFLPSILSSTVMVILFNYFINKASPDILRDWFNIEQTLFINNLDQKSDILLIFFYIWFGFGTTVLIFSNSMSTISPSLNEAMKLDGANAFTEFFHLIIPSIWPTITMFIVTAIAGIFVNQYNIMTFFGNGNYNGTLGYYIYKNVNEYKSTPDAFQLNQLAALGLICTAISIPLTFGIKNLLEKLGPKTN